LADCDNCVLHPLQLYNFNNNWDIIKIGAFFKPDCDGTDTQKNPQISPKVSKNFF
jgi:hypothetical protein